MAVAMQEALGPHQPQLPLYALQLKVETPPVDAVLPEATHRQLGLGVPCILYEEGESDQRVVSDKESATVKPAAAPLSSPAARQVQDSQLVDQHFLLAFDQGQFENVFTYKEKSALSHTPCF